MNLLTREKGSIEPARFKNIIDQLSPTLLYLNLSFQGEPYLHPQFTEMVKYARSKKIYVSSSTNGHFLTTEKARQTLESGLDNLIISLDGTDEDTYQIYRAGGDFRTVISGIKEIIKQKKETGNKKPRVIIQFLVLKSNQDHVNLVKHMGKELGADKVVLKTAQINDFSEGNPLIPDLPGLSRYKKIPKRTGDTASYKIKNRLPNHCFRVWSKCVVTWDGAVVPCCFDKDAKYRMGNIDRETFNAIWRNDNFREFRKKILSSRKSINICNNCTEGTGWSYFL
jgi:radical SAM protein with 4Fe4S-binding SPASM domain